MKIIYKQKSEEKQLTFGDVKDNQFFVSHDGRLFQKSADESANQIASSSGTPFSVQFDFAESNIIQRIIPEIEKIEF
jgi:hypothetical protein